MQLSATHLSRHMLDGTVRLFLAEALFPLTGLITAAFLTRRLGPDGYGLFILATSLVLWIETSIEAFFARATIKLVSDAEDWRPVGSMIMRWHLAVSGGAALLLSILASPLATLLREPVLATYLRLLVLDIPLYSLARVHRDILVGVGWFGQRALISVGRWIARLLLIVLLVELGLSVPGAILGSIGASLVELIIGRFYIRPSLLRPSSFPARQLLSYVGVLFLFALSLTLYNKLDLFVLKVLGGAGGHLQGGA